MVWYLLEDRHSPSSRASSDPDTRTKEIPNGTRLLYGCLQTIRTNFHFLSAVSEQKSLRRKSRSRSESIPFTDSWGLMKRDDRTRVWKKNHGIITFRVHSSTKGRLRSPDNLRRGPHRFRPELRRTPNAHSWCERLLKPPETQEPEWRCRCENLFRRASSCRLRAPMSVGSRRCSPGKKETGPIIRISESVLRNRDQSITKNQTWSIWGPN